MSTTIATDALTQTSPGRSRRAMLPNAAGLAMTVALLGGIVLGVLWAHRAGWGMISVHGGSMGDTIPIGSLVIARTEPAADVAVGDVILINEQAEDGSMLAPKLHRIVVMDERDGKVVVKTKGDGNSDVDPSETILGEHTLVSQWHMPRLGYWLSFMATPSGWLITAALPFTAVAALVIASIWRKKPVPA